MISPELLSASRMGATLGHGAVHSESRCQRLPAPSSNGSGAANSNAYKSQGQEWQVVGRNCRAVSEQEGLSPGGWREEALLMDAMHLGAQSRELPFWAGGLVPRKPILGSGCLELALTET